METLSKKGNTIQPFQVQQAIVGIRLKPVDHHLLAYLRFFMQQLPVQAAQWVYVQPDFSFVSFYIQKDLLPLIDQYEVDHQLLKELKNTIASEMGDGGTTKMTYHICEGDPLEEMLHLGPKINADLMVIGQHEGKGYHSILAKNLVRKLRAAALIVPENAAIQLSTILVPIDFSANARRALNMAMGMAQQMEGQVKVKAVYVYTIPAVHLSKLELTAEAYTQMVRNNIRRRMEEFVRALDEAESIEVAVLLEEQKKLDIPAAILQVARREGVDFLVMGAKGHSKVEHLLIGSVTEQVVNNNDHIPILISK